MPVTTYMQRHPRHDHGFTIPDPLLTKQFGVPNACNKCHTDKDTEWSLEALEGSLKAMAEERGLGLGKLAQPLRAALTGQTTSPGIFDVLVLLGREESLARIGAQASADADKV